MTTPTSSHAQNRLPRFRRDDEPGPLQLTQRDLDMVRAVARFRFLSSPQIARLAGGSHQQVLRRLRLLFDHGLLDRPRVQIAQLAHVHDDGNRPLVYGLARNGARVLAGQGVQIVDRVDWTTKNARATALFLAHTIETADAMIAFDLACRQRQSPIVVDHHELLPWLPETTRALRNPFQLAVDVALPQQSAPISIAVVPDRLFALAFPDATRLNFALELDRGTMDIKARQLVGKSSFRRKLLGYWHAWRGNRHTETWGFKAFRVLTVTTSDTRIAAMIAAQREIVGAQGSNLFLFTSADRIRNNNPLGPIWTSGKGETVALFNDAR